MNNLFEAYKRVLEAHIYTKTKDPVFHDKSAWFYELLFEVFHSISEKKQDIETWKDVDCDFLKQRTYDDIEMVKNELIKYIELNESVGMDNLLRWLVDKLESACWTARSFVKEEEEEEENEDYTTKKYKGLFK